MEVIDIAGLFPKQRQFFEAFKSGLYFMYVLAGGTGSGKTISALALLHILCLAYPGIRFAVFRKSEKNLKQTAIPSFKKAIGFTGTSSQPKIIDMSAKYHNGSEIMFLWADSSKDFDYDNVKGLEVAGALFEEANQIDKGYVDIVKTRVGRWNQSTDGQYLKPFIILTMNPNNEWPKTEYYDRAQDNTLPKGVFWQMTLPEDNPTITKEQWEMLNSLPENEFGRYVKGNWAYNDDPAQLITYAWYKNCLVNLDEINVDALTGDVIMANDPKDEGKDTSVSVFMKGNTLFKVEQTRHEDEIMMAHRIEQRMNEMAIRAKNIIIDTIGVGAGTGNTLKHKGHNITKFVSGESPESEHEFYKYRNKRAEAGWLLRDAMMNQEIAVVHSPEMQKQLLSIRYMTKDKYIQIESKDEIRKRLGYSPDIYDAVAMANYLRKLGSTWLKGNIDDHFAVECDLLEQYKGI